ncbi:GMC oxidoreductase [Streptomyces sp. NPDC001185]|uniref:GMC oxidoreductase n=1 Tax=Streptomyces sp. NPDC001185 TaxID=3154380 RepID=UPI00332F9B3B
MWPVSGRRSFSTSHRPRQVGSTSWWACRCATRAGSGCPQPTRWPPPSSRPDTSRTPEDVADVRRALDTARSIGAAPPLQSWIADETQPGAGDTDQYLRETVQTFWPQTRTARMGNDDMAVVDSRLRIIGCRGLRVADASVLPRVPMANTMAPSVAVGEQAALFLRE